jgi:hypothetical protein
VGELLEYARVSTADQSPDSQADALAAVLYGTNPDELPTLTWAGTATPGLLHLRAYARQLAHPELTLAAAAGRGGQTGDFSAHHNPCSTNHAAASAPVNRMEPFGDTATRSNMSAGPSRCSAGVLGSELSAIKFLD